MASKRKPKPVGLSPLQKEEKMTQGQTKWNNAKKASRDKRSFETKKLEMAKNNRKTKEANDAKTAEERQIQRKTKEANDAKTAEERHLQRDKGPFPYLFPLGLGLPKEEAWLLEHCWKYYDGRFEDPMWIATMFSQKQRHACIRKTARVASGNPRVLERLGSFANSKLFRDKLVNALRKPPRAADILVGDADTDYSVRSIY
jgi:hypothetical protein